MEGGGHLVPNTHLPYYPITRYYTQYIKMLPENPNSHMGINATSISQQTTPSLLELAEQAAAAATAIAKQLREKNVAEPRFHPPCAGLPNDPEIREARQQLLVASRALGVLSHDPLSHLRETILQVCTVLFVCWIRLFRCLLEWERSSTSARHWCSWWIGRLLISWSWTGRRCIFRRLRRGRGQRQRTSTSLVSL